MANPAETKGVWAAVSGGEALRDDPNNGCEGDYVLLGGCFLRVPPVKATCCCVFCFAFSIGEDSVLLRDCFCEYHW